MISMNLARNAALAVATGRVALGVTALLRPGVPARPWVGAALAAGPAGQVFGRALGGRDLGLGLGALLALLRPDSSAAAGWVAAGWVAGGALADGADVLATVAAWPALPRWGRLGILGLAGGAAAVGALTAVTLAGRSRLHDAEVQRC
ncbi:MAG TPA: hypothetical protein VJT72_17705 [Pseudonocardiaceae bacterium]|nr:hypothetical protein [Pseudonocardiaceae bacterium]